MCSIAQQHLHTAVMCAALHSNNYIQRQHVWPCWKITWQEVTLFQDTFLRTQALIDHKNGLPPFGHEILKVLEDYP